MKVRRWTMELKEEIYNTGLAFVWATKQECNLRNITKMLKDRCNDIERQNILAKLSEKLS
jgi:DNA-binding transcriptional regulator of glucitol operon